MSLPHSRTTYPTHIFVQFKNSVSLTTSQLPNNDESPPPEIGQEKQKNPTRRISSSWALGRPLGGEYKSRLIDWNRSSLHFVHTRYSSSLFRSIKATRSWVVFGLKKCTFAAHAAKLFFPSNSFTHCCPIRDWAQFGGKQHSERK